MLADGFAEDSSAVESECNFSFEGNRSCCSNNKQLASQAKSIHFMLVRMISIIIFDLHRKEKRGTRYHGFYRRFQFT